MSFHYCRRQTWKHFNPEGIHINLYKIAKKHFFFFAFPLIYVQYGSIFSPSISREVFQNLHTYLISSLFTICQAQSHNAFWNDFLMWSNEAVMAKQSLLVWIWLMSYIQLNQLKSSWPRARSVMGDLIQTMFWHIETIRGRALSQLQKQTPLKSDKVEKLQWSHQSGWEIHVVIVFWGARVDFFFLKHLFWCHSCCLCSTSHEVQ